MAILVLGGGWQQLPAIRKAREMGLRVIVADYLESAPGRKEADRFYLVSTRDREAILALAGREAVDGVLAFASDPAELTAAYVAEECGLPGGPRDASGIIGILYFDFANREEAESYLSQIRCCLVVHIAAIAEVWSRKRNRMGRFFMQSDLQENILRMGEYMRPAFTERERSGIDVRAYA